MKKVIAAVLIFFSVLSLAAVAIQVTNRFTDFRVTPVTTDIMAPEITAGTLIISQKVPEQSIQVGDIIQIGDQSQNTNLLGRVIEIGSDDGAYYSITLKNDAQPLPESSPYKISGVSYILTTTVPLAGYVAYFLSSILGLIVISAIILASGWYYLFILYTPFSPDAKEHKKLNRQEKKDRKNAILYGQYGGAEEMKSWFTERNATV